MNTSKKVTVGARSSPLSLAQTEEVLRLLRARFPDTEFVVIPISTDGDRHKNAPLLSMERGMFVKEIELALLNGEIDFAVHSAKDMPSSLPDGLVLAAFTEREDPRDVLVSRSGLPFDDLPQGARLGTSSPRRAAQLLARRSDLKILPIRGNVDTRMEKAHSDEYDGVVLAASGIIRLGRQDEITEYLSPELCLPDTGQGALAVEARAESINTIEMLAKIDHWPTSAAVKAERAFMESVGGGCKVPVAAYAQIEGSDLVISAMAAVPDGSRVFRVQTTHTASDPISAGQRVAEELMNAGAREIIDNGAV
ncbi:MAG: hydroxymethylbilane synthase [Chloroflexi bacterium]|nr:hydroxymethylbilane synthase [Chloroflexota bacterium]